MDYSDLKMQVGKMLQLQPRDGEDARRMHVKLIGYLPGASLLVTTPKVGDRVMIVRESQPYVVRMMIGNRQRPAGHVCSPRFRVRTDCPDAAGIIRAGACPQSRPARYNRPSPTAS